MLKNILLKIKEPGTLPVNLSESQVGSFLKNENTQIKYK